MNKWLRFFLCNPFFLVAWSLGASAQSPSELPDAPLTLQQAIRMTLARAPEISIAEAQANRANEALRETRSANLPQVVTGTGMAYNNGFPLSIEGSAPSIIQIGMSQPILSKKNKALIREAEESSKAVRLGSDVARNEVAARTAILYCELHQARKVEALWAGRLDAALRDQQTVSTLVEGGKARPVELTLAKSASAAARQQLLVAQEQSRLTASELRELTGMPADAPLRTVDPQLDVQSLSLSSEALFQKALEIHPEIRQAEANLRAREFHVAAEKGEKYPRLEIVSQYALFSRANHYDEFFNRFTRNNFLVGLSVQVPLFNGFRTSARVAQSRQEAAEAGLRLQRAKSELKLGIERSASGLRIARSAADLSRIEVEAARESLQVNESLFEAGRIGPREIENARNLVREKELGRVDAMRVFYQRQIDLLRIVGALAAMGD